MTQAAYARHRKARRLPGATREAVRKAVAEHRIDLLPNRRIDPGAADRAWAQRSIPKDVLPDTGPQSSEEQLHLTSERAQRERVRRNLDELRFMQATGKMVLAAPILSAATEAARKVLDRMRALAARLGPTVAPISDPVECTEIIDAELRLVCAHLTKPMELLAPGLPATNGVSYDLPPLTPLPPQAGAARGRFGR